MRLLLLPALMLSAQYFFAGCQVQASTSYSADFTPEHGLRWRHSGQEMKEHQNEVARGDAAPLPTARGIRDALSNLVFQSLENFVTSRAGHRRGSSRKLLMEGQSLERHPAAQLKPTFMDADTEICDKDIKWSDGQYERVEAKFKENYKWWTSFGGHFFFGTDEIVLKQFDGAIAVQVEEDTMRLTAHSSGGRSNVRAGMHNKPDECGKNTDMLKIGLRLNKLGVMAKGGFNFNLFKELGVSMLGMDKSLGFHLHEFKGISKFLTGNDQHVELELEVAIDASARFNQSTGMWSMTQKDDVKACCPGIKIGGALGKKKIFSGVMKHISKKVLNEIFYNFPYCFVKYQLGHLPWLGQIAQFVAEDNLNRRDSNSMLKIILDEKLTFPQNYGFTNEVEEQPVANKDLVLDDRAGSLHLRVGHQLDVPTLPFISHMLRTSQLMAARLKNEQRESEREASTRPIDSAREARMPRRELSKEDEELLDDLQNMGFDESVLDAILIIREAISAFTQDASEASVWIGGMVKNVWKVLFADGNDIEAMASFGLRMRPDSSGNAGGLTGEVNRLKVAVDAKKTPIDLEIFFRDVGDLVQNLKEGKGVQADRKWLKYENLFYLEGKASLVDIANLSLSGSTQDIQPQQAARFFEHPFAANIVHSIIELVNRTPIHLDISTENSLPGATIHHMSMNTKRIQSGAELVYAGPLHLEEIFTEFVRCAQEGADILNAYNNLIKSPKGKCLEMAKAGYVSAKKHDLLSYEARKKACNHKLDSSNQ